MVETDTIASIAASPIGPAVILVIMYYELFKTGDIIFIGDLKTCLTSHWPIIFNISQFLRMRVKTWPNIFVDQGQFSEPDFISGTHQWENVQFADKYGITADMKDEKDIITRIAACSRPSKLTLYTIIAFWWGQYMDYGSINSCIDRY